MARILIICNDPQIREIINVDLKTRGYVLYNSSDIKSSFESILKYSPDIVICEYEISGRNGIEVLKYIKHNNLNSEFILMTDKRDLSVIDIASSIGYFDYILKPISLDKLNLKILRSLKIKEMTEELSSLRTNIKHDFLIENNLAYGSPLMKQVSQNISKLSNNYASVFIQGDSGVGKELVAKILHYSGITEGEPFIKINCTEFNDESLLKELFGFSNNGKDGSVSKIGRFELAKKGTIYIDEISGISKRAQELLLDTITKREFNRINDDVKIKLNARVIFSSLYDLRELVESNNFHPDLSKKLEIFKIQIPPLKKRKEDIPLIVTQILKKINKDIHKNVSKVPIEVIEYLQDYDWPGNVRELENVLYQAILRTKNDKIQIEDINWSNAKYESYFNEIRSLEEVERQHIINVLNKVNWNKPRAIKLLGISKPTLYAKLKKYNLFN